MYGSSLTIPAASLHACHPSLILTLRLATCHNQASNAPSSISISTTTTTTTSTTRKTSETTMMTTHLAMCATTSSRARTTAQITVHVHHVESTL
jgi:hypothetical protein